MTFEVFAKSINDRIPPTGISKYLEALWYDGKGDWEMAHNIIQDIEDKTASWIHAYLHRKEGDIWNADYWYNRAGRKRPDLTLADEWKDIVINLLY